MTEEQFNKAMNLNKTLSELSDFIKSAATLKAELQYTYNGIIYKVGTLSTPKSIKNIFDRHDAMIRQEIEDEIQKLKDEIKTL